MRPDDSHLSKNTDILQVAILRLFRFHKTFIFGIFANKVGRSCAPKTELVCDCYITYLCTLCAYSELLIGQRMYMRTYNKILLFSCSWHAVGFVSNSRKIVAI